MIWSWVLSVIGVTGLYLAGRKIWWAWTINFFSEALWLAYAISTKQYGFIVGAVAFGWVYAKNALAWYSDKEIRSK